ncbi:type II toxin-antitoxin system RelE/ParE family toxin [Pantoea agglomerans]
MTVYVTKIFERNLKKEGIDDARLCIAAQEIISGLYDADLGGNVFKKRLPLAAGKSGGARTVVAYKSGKHLFFVNGWTKKGLPKGGQKEISDAELQGYRDAAAEMLAMTDKNLEDAVKSKIFREVKCDGKPSEGSAGIGSQPQ